MLDLALARTDHDFTVSSRAESTAGKRAAKPGHIARDRTGRSRTGRSIWQYATSRNLAVAAMSAITLGFLVNAMALQKARHPAPLFAAAVQASQPAPVNAALAEPPAPLPRPADLGSVLPATTPKAMAPDRGAQNRSPASPDPIAQLLRPHVPKPTTEAAKPEPSKSVMAAQRALVKLGFVLKADGVFGGTTRQAIERFERDQGMPVKGDLTPKILRQLTAEAGIPAQ